MIYCFQKFDENAGRQWLDHFLYSDESTTKDENCHIDKEGKIVVTFILSIHFNSPRTVYVISYHILHFFLIKARQQRIQGYLWNGELPVMKLFLINLLTLFVTCIQEEN